jgi:hypothetical protein
MLNTFLQDNIDVFAKQPSQMPRISWEVIEHHLKIYSVPSRCSRSPVSNLLSGKTSFMKKSRSCSTLA